MPAAWPTMNEESFNPYSPPVSDPYIPLPESDGDLPLASPLTRLGSAIIDGVIQIAIFLVIRELLALAGITSLLKLFGGRSDESGFATGIVEVVFFYLIHWRFLASTGQTIGKKITKIKIVTMEGKKPSMLALCVWRYGVIQAMTFLPSMFGFLSLLDVLFIFRKDRRCIHDLIAGTRVVQIQPRRIGNPGDPLRA